MSKSGNEPKAESSREDGRDIQPDVDRDGWSRNNRPATRRPVLRDRNVHHPIPFSAPRPDKGGTSPGRVDNRGWPSREHDSVRGTQAGVQPPRLLLSVVDAASLLGIGRTKVYELIATGELTAVSIGRARRVRASDLERFVEQLVSKG